MKDKSIYITNREQLELAFKDAFDDGLMGRNFNWEDYAHNSCTVIPADGLTGTILRRLLKKL